MPGIRWLATRFTAPSKDHYLTFIETGWTSALEQALLLRRHALHSALLRLDSDPLLEWRAPLPPDLAAWTHAPITIPAV